MKTTALFLVCCLAVAFATEDIFAEIKTSKFGKTLVDTIELQLNSQTDINYVIQLVKDLKQGLLEQKQATDAKHQEEQQECQDDFTELDTGINTATNDISKFERLIQMDEPVLEDRESEVANKQAELAERQAQLKQLEDARKEEVEKFNAIVAEHNLVRSMLHQARAIMEGAFSPGEFLQTSMLAEVGSTFRNFKPKNKGLASGYGHIFKLLAKICERAPVQADSQMIDTIFDIFDRLEENLDNSLALERQADEAREATFQELVSRQNAQITSLMGKISDLNREIHQLELTLAQNQDNLDEATERLENLSVRRADREVECNEEDRIYNEFNANIMDEITTCGQAIFLMEDKQDLLLRYA